MPISLKASAGGGSFKPTFFSGTQVVPAGVSGNILVLTAPLGKKVRLVSLGCTAGFVESGITVTSDTGDVIANKVLQGNPTTTVDTFAVGQMVVTGGGGAPNFTAIDYIESSNTIVVTKTAGSTAYAIYYSYTYGD